ncbi:hypothetical protein HZD82_24480, partial [Pantoea agglomerans]|nr:hypothetical protein [Pantoea agglomerans]
LLTINLAGSVKVKQVSLCGTLVISSRALWWLRACFTIASPMILLKDCLWHDVASMQLLEREIDQLMTQHAWQQQPMLLKL